MKFRSILIIGYLMAALIILSTIYLAVRYMLLNAKEVNLLISTTIVALLAGFGLNLFMFRSTFTALDKLQMMSKAVAKNDFTPINGINSPKELSDLATDFNQMTESLQSTFTRLEESEQEKNEMIAQLAHDIKTPITSISLTVTALNDGIIPKGQQGDYLEIIGGQVGHLNALVEELSTVAEIDGPVNTDKRKLQSRNEVFFLDQFLLDVLSEFQTQLEMGKHKLDLKGVNTGLQMQTDKMKLTRIMTNLIGNSLKYSKHGTPIGIEIIQEADEYNVRIRNTGEIITEEDANKIFDRFYRIDHSRNSKTGGHGLGLYIAKRLASEIGGVLTLEHSSEIETSFMLHLPKRLFV
ncbi:HAMP domain-containing histidine kinase [Weissella muntiaci]|uniref:histidine kinase n=1 Tax=Weissella muntiaci TaxID=2508881 RepID=A0A6C2C4H0_9LACO|nr:HAMP domain-containing sensor histidine kinase [Weissella muntiaci]TYC48724.1 HAMP domain-containing histidine kinase [Weissella muntiaci]